MKAPDHCLLKSNFIVQPNEIINATSDLSHLNKCSFELAKDVKSERLSNSVDMFFVLSNLTSDPLN